MPTKTLLERQIEGFNETDRIFAKRFCYAEKIRRDAQLKHWISERLSDYCANPDTLTEHSRRTLMDGARFFRLVFEKPFDPRSFVHDSLSLELIELLVFSFGSRERFGQVIAEGGNWRMTHRGVEYAAWLFGFIDDETLSSLPVPVHTRAFPQKRKWRK